MARTIEIILPPTQTTALLAILEDMDDVIHISVAPGASQKPPGDIVTIAIVNGKAEHLLHTLAEQSIPEKGTIRIGVPSAYITRPPMKHIFNETSETTWEEVATLLRDQVGLDGNFLWLMFLSGTIATLGIYTNFLIFLVAAQILAPAVEPLLLLPFGAVCGTRKHMLMGAKAASAGFLVSAAGGALTIAILSNTNPRSDAALMGQPLVSLVSSISFGTSFYVSALAGIAAAIIISSLRHVLSSGVNIALTLIPGSAMTGAWLIRGQFALAGYAALNWLIAVGGVLIFATIVFAIKQGTGHHRRVMSAP